MNYWIGGKEMCNWMYLKFGEGGAEASFEIRERIERMPGVESIAYRPIGNWDIIAKTDGRPPEEILEEIKEIAEIEESKILHESS